ncbi:hypothetical protein AB1Y20_000246 [Prymnesium parvum]|uniref:Uncharacterized protein n=1 Tax=Prymnesium parvum TaxID=97485 RepID=A0AB34K7X6_PRYPA
MISEYELQRQANMASNKARLVEMGLEAAADDIRSHTHRKPAQVKRAREVTVSHVQPTRARSSRLSGLPPEVEPDDDLIGDPVDLQLPIPRAGELKRGSTAPRLTVEQSAKLDAIEPVSSAELTDEEVHAVKRAQEYLLNESTGSWREHQAKNTSLWAEKRQLLQEARDLFGLRWPTWLDQIQSKLPPMGATQSARDQTMFAIERAACGLGLGYKAWPNGVGVLLANDEIISEKKAPRPRILTLGADTEMLKREGQRLECKFGRDAGNGWAYNHALGKLRSYQEILLREKFSPPEQPSAPSVRDIEESIGWYE